MRRVLVAALLGIVGACFDAPSEAVMFSCDPDDDERACPSGYTCESDGCCHRDGTDVDSNFGGCKLNPGTGSTITTTMGNESGSSETGSGSSDSGSSSTASGSTDSGSSSSADASSSSGSSPTESSSSGDASSSSSDASSSSSDASSSSGDASSSSSSGT